MTSVYQNGECENDEYMLAKGREDMTSESQVYSMLNYYFSPIYRVLWLGGNVTLVVPDPYFPV